MSSPVASPAPFVLIVKSPVFWLIVVSLRLNLLSELIFNPVVTVTVFGRPIVTAAVSVPDPVTSISFVVPAILATYAPVVSVPSTTLSA